MGEGREGLRTFALSAYPLSATFRHRLDEVAGRDVDVYVLPELRRLRFRELARLLRSLRGTCLIASEDPGSETLLPILQTVASVTRATRIEVVRAQGAPVAVSRRDAAAGLAAILLASADGQLALRAARREIDALLAAERSDARRAFDSALVLNANLWFGLKTGGSIAHTAGVVNALEARGIDVTLATATEPVGVSAPVLRLDPPRSFGLPVESNIYRFGQRVPRVVRRLPPKGFVYQRHSVGSVAGATVARARAVPLVLEYNGSEVWVARNWGRPLRYEELALAAEDASLRHARLVVTISRALHDELVDRGVEPERVVWHPNGVDADAFSPERFSEADRRRLRARYAISPDAIVATFVGTFGRWHGAEILARATRANAEWARANGVRFLFVGDGFTMPDVRAALSGAEDVAVLAGLVPQAETPLHLAASDILVSPHAPNADGTPFFGSPTKLFEYMAAGKAIVASDLDQIGDVLRDDLAVLVQPGDVADLGRALRALVDDPARRAELGRRARARVLERYTWKHHVGAILERLSGPG